MDDMLAIRLVLGTNIKEGVLCFKIFRDIPVNTGFCAKWPSNSYSGVERNRLCKKRPCFMKILSANFSIRKILSANFAPRRELGPWLWGLLTPGGDSGTWTLAQWAELQEFTICPACLPALFYACISLIELWSVIFAFFQSFYY